MKVLRRVLILCLGLLLLITPLSTAEELPEIDYASLSIETLIALRTEIEGAILEQAGDKEIDVPVGTYIVGEHIPVGDYTVSVDGNAIMTIVQVDPAEPDAFGLPDSMDVLSNDTPTIGRLALAEGETLTISGGAVVMKKFVGLDFD